MPIQLKRAYEPASPADGYRILVERLWPRGVSKAAARLDAWAKELAPSAELRRWYGHDPERWPEFKRRYFAELEAQPEALAAIRDRSAEGTVTFVYGSREERHNSASALKELLETRH